MDGAKIHRPINVILHYTEEKKEKQSAFVIQYEIDLFFNITVVNV
jgi:hypothetical protein